MYEHSLTRRRRYTPRATILTVAILTVATSSASGKAELPPLIIRADVQIGGFRTYQHLPDAIRVFGQPASLRLLSGYRRACDAAWPRIGLTIRFFGRGCTGRSAFARAVATGARWRTIRNLRIGDTVSHIRSLYPHARARRGRDGRQMWLLFRRGRTTAKLVALTAGGRVTALIVSPATGELTHG